ncbi:hypothetical protein ACFLZA_01740 [Candidatus Neomarinimicrobiota bacterium]
MKKTITLLTILMLVVFMVGCENSINPIEPQTQNDNEGISLAKKPAPSLRCTIEYVFVGHLGIPPDAEGRNLIWDGVIHGDIEGQILWWFVPDGGPPNMPPTAHVGFYEARWEIWDGVDLLLAGESGGTTAQPKGKDGIWRGNGIVTEVSDGFEDWDGRHTYEGGNVNWDFPYSGEGIFRIN